MTAAKCGGTGCWTTYSIDIRARGPEAVEEYENGYYYGCRIVAVGRILYDYQADRIVLARDRGKPGRLTHPGNSGAGRR